MKIAKPLSASAPRRETSKSIPQLLINLLSITLVIFTPTASNVANAQTQESKTFLWKVDSPQNTLYAGVTPISLAVGFRSLTQPTIISVSA